MANPFLMSDEPLDVDAASNPFLMQDTGDEEAGDNPFLAGGNGAGGAYNPFAGFGDDADDTTGAVQTTTVADIFGMSDTMTTTAVSGFKQPESGMNFFDTTINESDDVFQMETAAVAHQQAAHLFDESNANYSSEDELKVNSKKPIPPRPTPPSAITQQLINSVADHLDQTSTHMLGRLPVTRSPSPISMRDLNSPSPAPDAMLGDFMDVGEEGDTTTQGEASFLDLGDSDNPFGNDPIMAADVQTKNPQRPPPPRPTPPKPAPPVKPAAKPASFPSSITIIRSQPAAVPKPVPAAAPAPTEEEDFMDMFGTGQPKRPPPPAKPPAPKTKEDILSLFSTPNPVAAPAPPSKPKDLFDDLMSGDIPEFVPSAAPTQPQPPPQVQPQPQPQPQPQTQPQPPVMVSKPTIIRPAVPPPVKAVPVAVPVVEPVAAPVPIEPPVAAVMAAPPPRPPAPAPTPAPTPAPVPVMPEKPKAITPTVVEHLVDDLPPSDEETEPTPIVMQPPQPDPVSDITDETETELQINVEDNLYISEASSDISGSNMTSAELPASVSGSVVNMTISESVEPSGYDHNDVVYDTGALANPFGDPIEPVTPLYMDTYAQQVMPVPSVDISVTKPQDAFGVDPDEFDAFAAKFDSTSRKVSNAFMDDGPGNVSDTGDAWGDTGFGSSSATDEGFGNEGFDDFLAMKQPPPSTPFDNDQSDEEKEFNVFIKPKSDITYGSVTPVLAPPPRTPQNISSHSGDSSPRFNPFDKGDEDDGEIEPPPMPKMERTDSQETPQTPLFDEDTSQPLEDYPRTIYMGPGWEMQLRQPNKKKITGQRFWKKIFIRLVLQGDNPVLQLLNTVNDKEPFQELPLQACYSVSEIAAQQFDQFGKIFTIKLQYVFYKERPGVRPGQVSKAGRISDKLSKFAAYAIQGDYEGVKEFGSDLKKLGLPVEHAPQISQLFKLGSMNYEDMKQFSMCIEEAVFKLNVHRDRALTYKTEEVQVTCVDELYVEQDHEGHIWKQIARVRLFFLGFLTGMPDVELGVNDMWRQGKEVVGRHDIIPVVTEEWIRLEGVEFHACVQQDEYERSRTIKFKPPDACYIELMRFRVRPPKNRELPLQLKATWIVTGNKVELRADILVPGFASRKLGQIPCEDVSIRFPIPECWIYLFRVEKHFRYGSVKSAHRRTGKIKGIERFLGTVETLQESLIEVTSGQAKYEHHHRAIVWRCPRLPKEGQGAYTTHQLVCKMALTSFDQIPETLAPYAFIEFSMPSTHASHTTVRSVSFQDSESDEPPEKYVRHLSRHEYRVGIESVKGESTNAYLAATQTRPAPVKEEPMAITPTAPSDSDSDSN